MLRVWYWILHAPENRPGGPWWARDFSNEAVGSDFAQDMTKLCHRVYKKRYNHEDVVKIDQWNIAPPQDAEEVLPNPHHERCDSFHGWRDQF